MQKWYEWLEHMKKKDEKRKNEGDASTTTGGANEQGCRRQCWISPQNHEANVVERRSADSEKHWQCDGEIQNMPNKPWRNEELKDYEEALPRLKEADLEKASRLYKAKTGWDVKDSTHKFFWT